MLFESWLQFDNSVFQWIGSVFQPGESAVLDGIFKFITMLGDKGWFFIVLALLFLLFNKTRKIGAVMAIALVLDVLLVNLVLKNVFERPRPYDLDLEWWVAAYNSVFPAGPLAEKPHDFSFPSGHTAVAFAGMLAWCFASRPKWSGKRMRIVSYAGVVLAFVMGFTRLYLGVHYATDVLGGAVVGLVCALLGYLIFRLAQPLYEKMNAPVVRFSEAHLPKIFW